MRPVWPPIAWWIASAGLVLGACGGGPAPDAVVRAADPDRGPGAATPTAPSLVASTPELTTTTTTTATSTTTSTTTATSTSTTVALALPGDVRTLLSFDRSVRSAAVFGDSMFASGTGASELVAFLEAGLAELGIDRVENHAIAGQAYVQGSQLGERGWHRLGAFLEDRLPDTDFPDADLALISLSRIDLNVVPPGADVDARVSEIVDVLEDAVAMLEAAGLVVAIIPAFGTNDEMFDGLQCGRGPEHCWAHELDAKITRMNRAVEASGLPLLFERFAGDDVDGREGTDATWFTEFDPTERWPDDGQHPNRQGERLIADNVIHHLARALGR